MTEHNDRSAESCNLKPCPFCGSKIKHIESWAKSFKPPRLYHEWHHVEDNPDCQILRFSGKIVVSATDDEEMRRAATARWNARPATDAQSVGMREALIASGCTASDGTYVHASMEDVLRALAAQPTDAPVETASEGYAGWHGGDNALEKAGRSHNGSSADTDDDETYEIGKRDGYEAAIQDLDIATGGDGEFKGSTIPGATVDVPTMKARIIARLTANEPQSLPTRPHSIYTKYHLDNWLDSDFAAHAAATRKTLAYLIDLENALVLSRPQHSGDSDEA